MNYKNYRPLKASLNIVLVMMALCSCQCSGQERDQSQAPASQKAQQESRMKARKDFIKREQKSIESYITDRGFTMKRSGTGLFYAIDKDSLTADTSHIKAEQRVTYAYQVYLLNGTLIYSSEEYGPATLVVDKQDEIIGLHEALKKMSLGDKGRFIIPSHLAYGVSGDQRKIPPLTALQYNLEILKVENLNQEK